MSEKFIELRLGSHMISHGYDAKNKEILEEVASPFSRKLVAVSRIKSVSEKYILTDYLDGRWVYWEYEGDFKILKKKLTKI
ncbi:hypothetical protein JQC67_18470 [Aurantibacter crassamenti]|uniref:hypothetical protein n=1 Tax=Aurantibacter crassamenti TaxID=1837375 RepID=UPI001939FB5D|nr:hypothetical protein [Aurantibacter crassamenti]MBM1108143.1 hypothetical protein [Aurantibacter crassamenti]